MESGNAPKRKKQSAIASLIRDIFTGGKGYRTVKGDHTPFPTAVVISAIAVTVLFLFMVFALIKVSRLSAEIASMKKELVTLASEEDTLRGEINRRYSFEEIENTAGTLGLSKDGGQKITLGEENESETTEQNEP